MIKFLPSWPRSRPPSWSRLRPALGLMEKNSDPELSAIAYANAAQSAGRPVPTPKRCARGAGAMGTRIENHGKTDPLNYELSSTCYESPAISALLCALCDLCGKSDSMTYELPAPSHQPPATSYQRSSLRPPRSLR
jgi:hypothetical protein